MRKALLGALLFFAPALHAQVTAPTIILVGSAPSGSCSNNLPDRQVASTGVLYSCQSSTWAQIGGSAGATLPFPGLVYATSASGGTVATAGQVSALVTGAINPSSTGAGTPGTGAFTAVNGIAQFSVKSYGAACDGSTDDSTDIQATITAAAVHGGNVMIPAATCNFATTLTRPRNVMIVGQGRNSSFLNYVGSTRAFVLGDTGSTNPPSWKGGFSHLTLEGPSYSGSTVGLYMGADSAGVISPTGTHDDDEEWLDLYVNNFGIGATVNNNVYLLSAFDVLFANNGQHWKDASTNSNCCERMVFESSIFGQSQSSTVPAIELDNNLSDYYFNNSSFDYNDISQPDVACLAGSIHATFTNVHFEKAHGERIHINSTVCNGEIHVFGGTFTTTGTGTTDPDVIGLSGIYSSQNVVSVVGASVNSNETLTNFIDANMPQRQVTVDSVAWQNFGNLPANCVNVEGNPIGITVRNTSGCPSIVGDAPTFNQAVTFAPVATTKHCAAYAATSASVTCTWSTAPVAGEFVVVGATSFTNTITSMTATDSAGNSYTAVAALHSPTYDTAARTQLFYFGPLTSSITTLTVTPNATASVLVNADTVTNISPSSPVDGSICYADADPSTTATVSCGTAITTTIANDYLFCSATTSNGGNTLSAGPGFTAGSNYNTSNFAQYQVQPAIGAVTPSVVNTGSSNNMTMSCAAFKAAGSPAIVGPINPSSTGAQTPGTGAFTTVKATGLIKSLENTQILTSNSSGITATTPGTAEWTWANTALTASTNYALNCSILYSQATGAGGVGFSLQSATTAATRWDAWGRLFTSNAGVQTDGSAQDITTTTATSIVTATPAATNTVYQAELSGTVQVGSTPGTINVLIYTGNSSDAVTIQAGSYCSLLP